MELVVEDCTPDASSWEKRLESFCFPEALEMLLEDDEVPVPVPGLVSVKLEGEGEGGVQLPKLRALS